MLLSREEKVREGGKEVSGVQRDAATIKCQTVS